ncbi:endonuclease/exonuclease/phosphatase family protein [Arcobacter sp. LA11]|uniref:endonuclease/exonuclease/phosphatase family protein n=1 Tax=Arcobacter sp. LA11 TaxID=1898176 RepID=UPI0009324B3C|nr:endonuclease/exonuclease/phosphatase family protein [Arcobacter sp. LA11]
MIIRFGTFNLFQFVEPPFSWYTRKDTFKPTEWEEKTTWLKNQIQKMDCDIIGFQEVFSKDALEKLVKELGFDYFYMAQNAKTAKQNPTVFVSTAVALASKHPIIETFKVPVHGRSILNHKIEGHFKFSRIPIKALIELPNKKQITVYVSHLKSNRLNEYEYLFNKTHTLKQKKEKVKEALEKNYSMALKQRLCEASSLFQDIKKTKTPSIFLCDLNDKEFSLTIDALTNKAYHQKIKKDSHILFDANYLFNKKIYNPHPEQKEKKRTATSYYQGYGNVIDYIFVSKEFNKKEKEFIAKIISYEIFDEHLQKNHDGSILQSDHAQVVCEVEFKKS